MIDLRQTHPAIPRLACSRRVQVATGKSLYEDHYALQKKEFEFAMKSSVAGKQASKVSDNNRKMTLYAEKPEGSRIFGTLDGYR